MFFIIIFGWHQYASVRTIMKEENRYRSISLIYLFVYPRLVETQDGRHVGKLITLRQGHVSIYAAVFTRLICGRFISSYYSSKPAVTLLIEAMTREMSVKLRQRHSSIYAQYFWPFFERRNNIFAFNGLSFSFVEF